MSKKNIKSRLLSYFISFVLVIIAITAVGSASNNQNNQADLLIQKDNLLKKINSRYGKRFSEGKQKLEQINDIMNEEYEEFNESIKVSKQIEQELANLYNKINQLKAQIKNIDIQVATTEKKTEAIENQIILKEKNLTELYEQIEVLNTELELQKEAILEYFAIIQKEEILKGKDELKNTLNLLFSDESFTDYLRRERQISLWEETERKIFYKLEETIKEIEEASVLVDGQRQNFENLKVMLKAEKENLTMHREARKQLIQITRGEQKEYEQLWGQSKKELAESSTEIQEMKDYAKAVEMKLKFLEKKAKAKKKRTESTNTLSKYEVGEIFEKKDQQKTTLSWPVPPNRGLTAYFMDKNYKKFFGVPHKAVDIRCAQGKPVKAPSLGFVYKVADHGYGYSYLILIHKNNIATVYGHVSKFLVNEGDMVNEGDIIALSGGMPGTKGAGVMTTGPHLHFEVINSGAHRDPLKYLPLEEVPIEYIPDSYLEEMKF